MQTGFAVLLTLSASSPFLERKEEEPRALEEQKTVAKEGERYGYRDV
jgi:hypothetical protein